MSFPVFASGDVLNASDMNAVGLWKITTLNFSGTVINIANCFSSNYLNYRIMINFTAITSNTFQYVQFSNGGVPDGNTNYQYAVNAVNAVGGTGTMVGSGSNIVLLGYSGTANGNAASTLDVYQPNVAGRTYGHSQRWEYDSANFVARTGGFLKDQITAFDGFAIGTAGGTTITGTVNVYGYR